MRKSVQIAVVAFLAALAVGLFMGILIDRERVAERKQATARLAAEHADFLQQRIYRALSSTDAIAALFYQGGISVESFESIAQGLLPRYPGVSALQLAPGGVIAVSVPLEGNEKVIGHDLLADPARNKEAFLAVQQRQLTLAGPFTLMQGGVAVIGRLPLYVPGAPERFWGFCTALLRIEDLLAAGRLGELADDGFGFELWRIHPDTGERHVFARDDAGALVDPVSQVIDVPNGRWMLSVAPRGGWSMPRARTDAFALAIVASLLVGMLAYLVASQPETLVRTVAERTQEIQRTMTMLESANALLEREIQEHAVTQDELAASNERFRSLIETSSDWVWEVDEHGVYTYVSPRVRDLLGYPPEEVLGRTPFDLMPPNEAQRIGAVFAALVAERRPIELLVNVNRRKDGSDVYLETSGAPIFDSDGEFRGYRGIDRDITQRLATEEHVRKLSRVVEQTVNAVMITDVNGIIEYVNPKFTEITGYRLDEVAGRNPRMLKSGEQSLEVYSEMWDTLRAGRPWMREIHNRRKDGTLFWCVQSISVIRNENGEATHFVSVMEDIDSRKHAESTIRRLAYYDTLTGLPNRRLFGERLENAIANAQRAGRSIALLYLDVDRLKNINDSLGHAVGDALLRAVGFRIEATVRREDIVARLEGDEFAVIVTDVRDMHDAAHVVEHLALALRKPFIANEHELFVTSSIGVTMFPQDGVDPDQLNRNADLAQHQAKHLGDSFHFFTTGMDAKVGAYLSMENQLRRAVETEGFSIALQPQADLATGRIAGAEALVRWTHPERGPIPPIQFIGIAEETGLIVPIGRFVLREACRVAVSWPTQSGPSHVAVNLSTRQFREGELLIRTVREVLEETGLSPERLELEITESSLMEQPDAAIATMRELAAMGITFAIDDFGTGYSSLAYLKQMPVQVLKIDMSFIRGLTTQPGDRAIVKSIIAMAREMQLRVVAEGVETQEQLVILRDMGCHEVQGYLCSRPVPPDELAKLVERGVLLEPKLLRAPEQLPALQI